MIHVLPIYRIRSLTHSLTHRLSIYLPSLFVVKSLSELIYLQILYLPENKLTGAIPGFIGKSLLELRHIDLSYNNLSGNLPTFGVRFISHLKTMRLHDNQIGGSIHELAGNLTELTALALHNNEIGGMLPESMTNMQKLEEVTMHNNQFSGPIPEVVSSLMISTVNTHNTKRKEKYILILYMMFYFSEHIVIRPFDAWIADIDIVP